MSTINARTTDTCTVTMRGQKFQGLAGRKVRITTASGEVEGNLSPATTEYQLFFTSGSAEAKKLNSILKDLSPSKSSPVEVEVTVLE
jgi:muramidase (phage lysozyme)